MGCCFLKYFETSFIFLADFAGMGEGKKETYEKCNMFEFLDLVASFTTWGLNFNLILFLKNLLVLSTLKLSH